MCDRELLTCPFCGKLPNRITAGARDNRVQCLTQFCPMENNVVSRCDWNRRAPGWIKIEDCPEEWKDGRDMILWARVSDEEYSYGVMLARYIDDSDDLVPGWYAWEGIEAYPAHVKPLPAPPEVEL